MRKCCEEGACLDEAISYRVLPVDLVGDCFLTGCFAIAPLAMTGWRMMTIQQYQSRAGLSAFFRQLLRVSAVKVPCAETNDTGKREHRTRCEKPLGSGNAQNVAQ